MQYQNTNQRKAEIISKALQKISTRKILIALIVIILLRGNTEELERYIIPLIKDICKGH